MDRKQALERIFVGNSEMARMMRDHDWSTTSLGDPFLWPQGLKLAVRILLTSKFEMWLGWGPDIAFLYNDAYRPTLGSKHGHALGVPTRELYSEIWEDVEPRLSKVYREGEATWDRALMLILHRHGYPEETYHTFSYSPLVGDTDRVEGVFCAVSEETERVISVRRLEALESLAFAINGADTFESFFYAAGEQAKKANRSVLFNALYRFEGGAIVPVYENLGGESDLGRWNLNPEHEPCDPIVIDVEPDARLPTGAWDVAASKAAILYLHLAGNQRPVGAMVVGLNPYRPFDADYESFLKLFVGQISARWSTLDAIENARLRAQALDEALVLRQEAAKKLAQVNQNLSREVLLRTEERDRFHAMFKQAPSFMALLSGPDHVFELANDAYLSLVGPRDVLGLKVRDALPDVNGQGFFEILDNVFATGQPYKGEAVPVRLKRSAGSEEQRYVDLIYQPIFIADKVEGIFVDGYDVTHKKNAEDSLRLLNSTLEGHVKERTAELERALEKLRHESEERSTAERALQRAQKMEALGALTGGVAHDFNNSLQVISANLQLLGRLCEGNPGALKRIEGALGGVARGAKLASQLLSFARRQPLEPKVVNVSRFIRSLEDMLVRTLGESIEVETVISGGLWNTMVDIGQVENAILNLAINARDAMDGRGKLTIEAGNALLDFNYCQKHEDLRPGQFVVIAVTDTGSGMTPEVMEKAFEPFFSTKPEGKGTGLGLSMVYGFAKQSGGHVAVYSEVGEGTTVKLYLPRSAQNEEVSPVNWSSGPIQGGTETVLVVEDDEDVRETAVAMLVDLGYRVLRAKDADSAMTVVDSGVHIDLLFTDVMMPGKLRSPELARKTKQRLPSVAVLFTSGYTENSIVHGGRLDEGVELLSKPYTREALARRVRHVLGNEAQRRQAIVDIVQATPHPTPAAMRLMVVEDDDLIRSATAEQLRLSGHDVSEAGNAQEALTLLNSREFDGLVLDLGLPGMSGAELARKALALYPHLGIVFASGSPPSPDLNLPTAARFVSKPYTAARLLEECELVVNASRAKATL